MSPLLCLRVNFPQPRLMELHGEGGDDVGVEMLRPEARPEDGCSCWHVRILAP